MTNTRQPFTTETDFLLNDAEVAKDPGPFFEHLRSSCPVARSDKHGGFWVISRYADLRAAALQTSTFSSAKGVTIPPQPNPPSLCLEQDDPEHRMFRRPMQGWFSPARIAALEDSVREVVTQLIDGVIDDGSCDIGEVLANSVPPLVIAMLMGLPEPDWPWFRETSDGVIVKTSQGDMDGAIALSHSLAGYLGQQLADRRTRPSDDLLGDIVGLEVEGKRLSEEEAISLAYLLLSAGHDTTVGALGGLLHHVARNPELRDTLLADRTLVAAAVEEALRLESPLMGLGRTLTRDTTFSGVPLPSDDRVMLLFGAGNRDPEVFEDPETFRLDRPHNRHLGFGFGIHRCVGAPLARLEMRVVLECVLERMPKIRVVDDASVRVAYHFTRVFDELQVTWTDQPAATDK